MTSLWRNISVNVVANSKWNFFINLCSQSSLKSATDCCQTERQIQQDASSSVCIARVSQKCLHENCPPVLEKEQCPPITEISSLGSDAQSYVETFIQIPKQFLNKKLHWRRYGTIFASQLIKLSRVLQIVWQEYVTVMEYILSIYFYSRNCSHFWHLRCLE